MLLSKGGVSYLYITVNLSYYAVRFLEVLIDFFSTDSW